MVLFVITIDQNVFQVSDDKFIQIWASTELMMSMNVLGILHSQNGRTKSLKCPYLVLNAVRGVQSVLSHT